MGGFRLENGKRTSAPARGARGDSTLDLGWAVVEAAAGADSLEQLARPLLKAIVDLGDLDSALLVIFDWERNHVAVRYAHNVGDVEIPEGLVECPTTVGPRALPCVTHLVRESPVKHPDCLIAQNGGLRTSMSVPVVAADNEVFGMLCAMSLEPRPLTPRLAATMKFAARAFAEQIVRDQVAAAERRARIAEETLRTRARFLAQVGHQLRSPLAVVRGLAEVLADHDGDLSAEKREEILDALGRNAEMASSQLEDLLAGARAEAQARELVAGPVDVARMIRVLTVAFGGVSHTHKVVADVAEELTALADSTGLSQVLGHLLDNAVKYSPGGGTIRVSARCAGPSVEIEVCDEGVGIPEEVDIFAPFARGRENGPGIPRGIGLGLHIVRNLVESMGGSVAGRRNDGTGSTFAVCLPAAP